MNKAGGIKLARELLVMLPRAMAYASMQDKITTAKFFDALSFNRECKVLEGQGIHGSYSTLCSYPIQLHQRLEPLKALFYWYAVSTTTFVAP